MPNYAINRLKLLSVIITKSYHLLITIIFVLITVSFTSDSVTYKTVYVSNDGNDENDGISESTPLKSLAQAIELNPRKIMLRRGDIFYESISPKGISIDAYGKGELPVVCGLKMLKNGAWERGAFIDDNWISCDTGHVWKACLALPDSCYEGFKTGGTSLLNNVGQIVDVSTSSLNDCRRVRFSDDLVSDYDFWLNSSEDALHKPAGYGAKGRERNDNPADKPKDYDYIYVYCNDNLNDKQIGFAVYSTGVRMQGGEIRNVKVTHWGRCGITGKSNTTIENCVIDAIGGSYFITYPYWLSYGNGIEFYIHAPKVENSTIRNNVISRCYDCGYTIQGDLMNNNKKNIRAENVVFENNLIENCDQSLEFFLNGLDNNDLYYNCRVRNNISLNAGINTGFRVYEKRYQYCHLLETSYLRPTGIIYENNTFANGNYYCAAKFQGRYNSPIWKYNICYILRGQDLMGNGNGFSDVIKVPTMPTKDMTLEEDTQQSIETYRSLTDDHGTQFVILDREKTMDSIVDELRINYYNRN